MKIKTLLFIAIILSSASHTYAEVADIDAITSVVIDNNPQLKAVEARAQADILDAKAANTLSGLDVSLNSLWHNHGLGTKVGIEVSQSFDWPGLYRARAKMTDTRRQALVSELLVTRRTILLETQRLVNEIVYNRQCIQLCDTIGHIYDNAFKKIQKAYNDGEISLIDLRKIQFEIYSNNIRRSTYNTQLSDAVTKLNALAAKDITHMVQDIDIYNIQPLYSLDQYTAFIRANNIEAVSILSGASIDRQQANIDAMSAMPSFSLGYRHEAEMGDRFNGFVLGLKLPDYAIAKRRKAAAARAQAFEIQATSAVDARIQSAKGQYETITKLSGDIKTASALFDNTYITLIQKAYTGGEFDIITYINELNYFYSIQFDILALKYNYHTTIADLNADVPFDNSVTLNNNEQ